jgi:hypothetical protein
VDTLVLLSWTLEPLMNCVLLLSRNRHLLSRLARRATYGFLAFTAAAAACAVLATVTGPSGLLPTAFGFGLWAIVTGSIHTLSSSQQMLIGYASAAAGLVGAMAIAATLVGASGAAIGVAIVLIGGIAATWGTAFAR